MAYRTPWSPRALSDLNPSCSPLVRESHSGGLPSSRHQRQPPRSFPEDARAHPNSTSGRDGRHDNRSHSRSFASRSSVDIHRRPEILLTQDKWLDCAERNFAASSETVMLFSYNSMA